MSAAEIEAIIEKRVRSAARLEAVMYVMLYCMATVFCLMLFASIGNIILFRWLNMLTIYPADIAGVAIGIVVTQGFIPFGLAKRMRANHKSVSDNYAAHLWRSARSHPAYYR